MTGRSRWWLLSAVAAVVITGATVYGVGEWRRYQALQAAPSAVDVITGPALTGPRVLFRNTAVGDEYGLVAAVPLDDPGAPRTISDLECDRVDATSQRTVCLRTIRGVITTFEAAIYSADGTSESSWPLPGIPSRTRLSEDSRLVATTAFVTGHSYLAVGFSTETVVTDIATGTSANIEEFELEVDGRLVTSPDRNMWGVTFANDDNKFYATAASGGKTWLVKGDLAARTLVAVSEGAECPALSPDESRIAFKKKTSTDGAVEWAVAILDLASGTETLLPGDRSVDDQVEWLDDSTVLYGLPRVDAVGDNDIWAVAADGTSAPVVFIEHAWSPAVVRGDGP